jgi:hypothetical protein
MYSSTVDQAMNGILSTSFFKPNITGKESFFTNLIQIIQAVGLLKQASGNAITDLGKLSLAVFVVSQISGEKVNKLINEIILGVVTISTAVLFYKERNVESVCRFASLAFRLINHNSMLEKVDECICNVAIVYQVTLVLRKFPWVLQKCIDIINIASRQSFKVAFK